MGWHLLANLGLEEWEKRLEVPEFQAQWDERMSATPVAQCGPRPSSPCSSKHWGGIPHPDPLTWALHLNKILGGSWVAATCYPVNS